MASVRGTSQSALRHPVHGGLIIAFGREYETTDKLVKAFPWAFEPIVESATAAPGEKRATRRPAKKSTTKS